jgi:hypothetical protein
MAMMDDTPRQAVVVTDIHMPFSSMVLFMVKWAIASIPALIILAMIGALFWGILGGLILSWNKDKTRQSVSRPGIEMPASVPNAKNMTEPLL